MCFDSHSPNILWKTPFNWGPQIQQYKSDTCRLSEITQIISRFIYNISIYDLHLTVDCIYPDLSTNSAPPPPSQADQKSYMLDCDESTTLQLQIETAEGPRVIPISGQHIITTADGQQFLSGMFQHSSWSCLTGTNSNKLSHFVHVQLI